MLCLIFTKVLNKHLKAMTNQEAKEAMYLDWFNNFLSTDRFSEHYNLGLAECENILDEGRKLNQAK